MNHTLSKVLKANAVYSANFGDKAKLAMPPARRFAVLTCMDARLDLQNLPDSPRATLM